LSPQDWAAVWPLLDEALALASPARAAWLDSLAQREPVSAAVMRRLLARADDPAFANVLTQSDGAQNPLDRGAAARVFAYAIGTPTATLSAGSMIGDYRNEFRVINKITPTG